MQLLLGACTGGFMGTCDGSAVTFRDCFQLESGCGCDPISLTANTCSSNVSIENTYAAITATCPSASGMFLLDTSYPYLMYV
jgi:hypothetical protein